MKLDLAPLSRRFHAVPSAIHYGPDAEGDNGIYLGKNVVKEASRALAVAMRQVGRGLTHAKGGGVKPGVGVKAHNDSGARAWAGGRASSGQAAALRTDSSTHGQCSTRYEACG